MSASDPTVAEVGTTSTRPTGRFLQQQENTVLTTLFWNLFINRTLDLPDWAFTSIAGQLLDASSVTGAL